MHSVLEPKENLWFIVKRDGYENGKQYTSKWDLWKAIKTAVSNAKIKTKSVY